MVGQDIHDGVIAVRRVWNRLPLLERALRRAKPPHTTFPLRTNVPKSDSHLFKILHGLSRLKPQHLRSMR